MARPSDPTARIRLLSAAETEFVRHGLDGAKIEDIASRAGASKGAFYLHFKSKDDLFRELVQNLIARLASSLADCPAQLAAAADSGDLNEFLDLWVSKDVEMFEFIWQNRGLCSLLMQGGPGASYRHLVDAFADQAAEQTRQILAHGVRVGIYRPDLDLGVAGAFIGGAYDRLARDMIRQPQKPDLRTWMLATQSLLLRGTGTARVVEAIVRRNPVVAPLTDTAFFSTDGAFAVVRKGSRTNDKPRIGPTAQAKKRRKVGPVRK